MRNSLSVVRPVPLQVVQREGFVAANAHEHALGGPALGRGRVEITVSAHAPIRTLEYRSSLLCEAADGKTDWELLEGTNSGHTFSGHALLPAGGWYRLEVRCTFGDGTVSTSAAEPVGVGEVFVIAGQSYAAGCNDELLRVEDMGVRAAALDVVSDGLAGRWGFRPPWLLAKSTLHPMVYSDPEGEQRIRSAVARLWDMPGFLPSPDTDALGGENRGGRDSRQHFSSIGQRRAGLMWYAAVWQMLNRLGEGSHV